MATLAFIVEDGTGKSNATSYATVENYLQYWINRGVDKSSEIIAGTEGAADDESAVQVKLNVATDFIDRNFTFEGERSSTAQRLQWPRYGVQKSGYDLYESNEMPQGLIDAVCYMATQVTTGEILEAGPAVKSESYGSNSRTYVTSDKDKQFPQLDALLKGLVFRGRRLQRIG